MAQKRDNFFFFEICFWPFHKKYQDSYHKKLNYQTKLSMSTKAIQTRNQKKKQKTDNEDDYKQSPLALLFTEQWKDIFEEHIVPKLKKRSELKFLKMAFKNARDAVERSKIKVGKKINISEFTSISQMEFAWDNYRWDEDSYYGTQEWFCSRVAEMNKLEYLVWLREVKNCDWNSLTIRAAVYQGNLAMVKYCVDNGCPIDAWALWCAASKGYLDVLKYLHENDCPWSSSACAAAHNYNRIDCLNYLIEQKCPGFERYLPPAAAAPALAQ
jgi:hypothetical protein